LNTLTSIYKHGSWLALDILNEGTFRGHPKFENKFSRLLKQLFSLPFINKHRDISKLPEGIKKDWILSFIEAGIDSNDKNLIFTGFAIASVLIKSGRSELRDLYIKWNLNSVESNELLLFLVKNKLFSKELVFDILFTKIQNGKVLECYEIITSHEVKKILSEIDYSGSDPKIGGELINCLFFSIFYYYISENYDSKILSALLKNESYVSLHELGNLFKGEEKVITFNIVENIYVGEVNIIFVTDLSKLDAFMKAIEFYECDLAKSVVLFYLNPSILSLKNVMYVVNKIHGDAIKHVKNYLANLNWLFHMIFNSRFNNDELISKIESGFFGDDKTWRVTESGFTEKAKENTIEELLAHTSYRRLSIDSPIALESFFNTIFASHTDSEILHAEAIRMLSWAAFDNYGNVKKSINESLEQVILKSYKKCYVENQEDELFDLNITYYIFDLIAFVSSKNLLLNLAELNSAFERVPLKSRNLFSIRENEKLIYAFYKIIGIYKVEIATNPNSSIIRLVPLLLTQESLSLSLFNSKKNEINIEFNYKSIDPINQFSLACLLLLCLPNDISHAAKIENLLNGLDLTDEMIEVYLKILEKMNFTKDINMILLLLNNKVTNYSHRSLYLAILKNFVESQPSNITEIM
jgi:hypothetical protein